MRDTRARSGNFSIGSLVLSRGFVYFNCFEGIAFFNNLRLVYIVLNCLIRNVLYLSLQLFLLFPQLLHFFFHGLVLGVLLQYLFDLVTRILV